MKTLSTNLKAFIVACIFLALPLSFATNIKTNVFVNQHHQVIELGHYVKTLDKHVPVHVFYNQHSHYVYYTWFDAHTNLQVVKAYYQNNHKQQKYITTYYGKYYKTYH